MRFSSGTFDVVSPAAPIESLPARLSIAPESGRTTANLIVLFTTLALLMPPAVAAIALLIRLGPVVLLDEQPATVVALILYPTVWTAFSFFALTNISPRLRGARRVALSRGEVRVAERSLLRLRVWREPVSAYLGLAHNIRATMAGTHHELVLVHGQPEKSVLLYSASSIALGQVEHYAALLGVPVIPARELYRIKRAQDSASADRPVAATA